MNLKIYYLSTEIEPFSNTNSLSNFSKEFSSIANNEKEYDIRLVQPKYNYISDRRFILREVIRLKELNISVGDINEMINLRSGFIPGTKVQVYFMEHEKYFDVSELIYKSKNGRLYKNNHEKFTFFCYAALDTLKKLFWTPDVLIYNDWQTSLCPIITDQMFSETLSKTKKVFFVHSINELYNFDSSVYDKFHLNQKGQKLHSNNLINAIQSSDIVYFMNDIDNKMSNFISKDKDVKKVLKNSNYNIIDYNLEMEVSERIDIYNGILSELNKTKK